jgi:NodT family efflux transporter outer membrane factor (OMF) lipoprotein
VEQPLKRAVTLLAGVLAGCMAGPDYVAPQASLPSNFKETTAPTGSAQPTDTWWQVFGDTVLDGLMAEALHSAPDLAEASARLREARALQGIAVSAEYPNADAGAGYDRTRGSANVPIGVPPGGLGPGEYGSLWQAGFDASWEVDLFGGQRRAVEAANASYQAAEADKALVQLSLLAEIARNYMELRGTQRQLAVAQENLTIQQDALHLTQAQFNAGLAPRLDLLRATALVNDTQSTIPALEAEERSSIYRIGALVGRMPEDLVSQLDTPQPIPPALPDVPVGLPSDLLLRRPDIHAAERQIAAANARIGVATADLYPHFSLTGVAGLESLSAKSFPNASSSYFAVGPSVTWLIFDAGKVRFEIDAQRARTDQAVAAYRRTVLNALRDVESALVACARDQERKQTLSAEVESDRQAVDLATRLYSHGLTDFLSVLDAERSLDAAEDRQVQNDRDTALALVALFKAMGGGWTADGAPQPAKEN